MAIGDTKTTLRVGVLFEHVQFADLACMDVLNNLSTQVVSVFAAVEPRYEKLLPHAQPMEFLFLAPTLDPYVMTTGIRVVPTHTYETAPKDLDMLLIGGPPPSDVSEASKEYIKEAVKRTKTVMSVCTGGWWLATAGVLDGKKATTNRGVLPLTKKFHPDVEWLDQRWVVEKGWFEGAELWTSGGAGAGKFTISSSCCDCTDER